MRDLTPFGFLRLDMRPAHAVAAPPGTWGVEVELGYQNTWVLSPNVEEHLRGFSGRRSLTDADVQAIRNLPGEAYLVDLEIALLELVLHYKLDARWGAYLIQGAASYGGGFLDSMVENFHAQAGLGDYARPALTRNQFNTILDLKSVQLVRLDAPPPSGMLDPVFGLRYALASPHSPWSVVLEGAAKAPLSGARPFLSTGRWDVGLQATLQRFAGPHAFYGSLAAVYTDGSETVPAYRKQTVPTAILGYEYRWSDTLSLIGQVYGSDSVFDRGDTDLAGLLKPKLQLSLGARYRVGAAVLSFAVTENIGSFDNTPDIGLQLGWAYSPALGRRQLPTGDLSPAP